MGAESLALVLFAFVLTYAIHSTLLLGLACLVSRRISALRARERLWKVALFGGLATALVQVGFGLHTPLAHWSLRSQAVEAQVPVEDESMDTQPIDRETVELGERAVDSEIAAQQAAERTQRVVERALLRLTHLDKLREPRVARRPAAPSVDDKPRFAANTEPVELAAAARSHESLDSSNGSIDPTPAALPATLASATPPPPSTPGIGWRGWLWRGLLAWAGFAAVICAIFGWMWLRLAQRLRGRYELASGELRDALDGLVPIAFPRGRRIRLFVAPDLAAPLSFGWVRASICVPPRALYELSPDEQATMLAHELAHLRRRDPAWLSLAWFIERVFFFQPLNRVARAQLHDAAELLCDDWAVRRTGNRVALASCLAHIASWIVGPARALPATSMAEGHGRSRLGQRIERLLDEHAMRHEEQPRAWIAPIAAGMLSGAVLVVPGVSAERDHVTDEPRAVTVSAPCEPKDDESSSCEIVDAGAPSLKESDLAALGYTADPAAADTPSTPDAAEAPAADPISTPAAGAPPAQVEVIDLRGSLEAMELLDEAVAGLQREISALRGELSDVDGGSELEAKLDDLDARAARLDQNRTRMRRLVIQLVRTAGQVEARAEPTGPK